MRQIKDANASLYQDVKAARRSLNGALAEISPPRDTGFREFGLGKSGAASQELDGRAQNEMRDLAEQAGGKWREALKLGEYFLWRIACGRAKRRQPLNSHRVPQPSRRLLLESRQF